MAHSHGRPWTLPISQELSQGQEPWSEFSLCGPLLEGFFINSLGFLMPWWLGPNNKYPKKQEVETATYEVLGLEIGTALLSLYSITQPQSQAPSWDLYKHLGTMISSCYWYSQIFPATPLTGK